MDSALKPYLAARAAMINQRLDSLLAPSDRDTGIVQAMRHSLMAGGKRLRPVLCLAAAEAVGAPLSTEMLDVACALEMIHTYSLIHDDLPAMDNDDLRRGHPTCHKAFDEATAILAGDALLTLAFQVMAAAGLKSGTHGLQWLTLQHEVAGAAGYQGMIEGQMQDMAAEGQVLDLQALRRLHALKTGRIIEISVWSGALMGNATSPQVDALRRYARHIGLAFQVMDDILNVEGDPDRLGKAVGTDRSRGKNTYPALLGLGASKTMAGELVNDALIALNEFDKKADPLRAVARYIVERRR